MLIEIEGTIPTDLSSFATYQVYNCLDSAVTAQLLPAMCRHLNDNHLLTYKREMRLQSLCLDMSTKGFPVDQFALAELLWKLEKDENRALSILHRFCDAVDFPHLNPNSPAQVIALFYTHLGLPPVYEYDRKTQRRKISTDAKALEKLKTNYPIAAPFVNAIDAAKSARKMASVFKRGLEPGTANLRCNFSPSGTETGRLSSQQNPYGRGTNAQNLTDEVRQVICAPDDYLIVNFDLKTAESIAVGYLSKDLAYINACLSGDLHTQVAKLNFRDLPWVGNLKQDKAIAEQPYFRQFSYRDMAKRGGHATNYYGQAPTVAAALKLPRSVVEQFQSDYFAAFPGIQNWHLEVIAMIQTTGSIITPMGRERRFWGRPDDKKTHREAIAHGPQSLVGDVWNDGLIQLQAWTIANAKTDIIDLRAQVHDAGVYLIPKSCIHDLIPLMSEQLKYPIDFGPLGVMVIPTDVSIGRRWNKAPKYLKPHQSRLMQQGLVDYRPGMDLDAL